MSGVIDEHGQWEHCHVCNEFVLIQDLLYEQPSERFGCGRDLCAECAALPAEEQERIAEEVGEREYQRSLARYKEKGWTVRGNADRSISILHIPGVG